MRWHKFPGEHFRQAFARFVYADRIVSVRRNWNSFVPTLLRRYPCAFARILQLRPAAHLHLTPLNAASVWDLLVRMQAFLSELDIGARRARECINIC